MSREGIKAHSQSAAECKEKHEGVRERRRGGGRENLGGRPSSKKKRRRRSDDDDVCGERRRAFESNGKRRSRRNKVRRRRALKAATDLQHTRKGIRPRLYFIAGLFERQRRRFEKFHGKHHLFCISLEVLPRTRTTKSSTTTTI